MNTTTASESTITEPTGRATYCPEDNKLRMYVGRVPREEYEALRAAGWTSTPKQECDFVAVWTPTRRDTALDYAGVIEDEDQSPAERAADRAERFAGYREKRAAEANSSAARYEAGPSAFGFQSQARADRAAARFDRIAARAVDSWDKAEYWQSRTAGVISHALHVCAPSVRMGRIKELEADIRRIEKSRTEYEQMRSMWLRCSELTDTEKQNALAARLAYVEHGDYTHPRTGRKSYLYDLARAEEGREPDPLNGAELCALYLSRHGPLAPEGDWLTHYRNRLAYENQMLEAQGGRAAYVEMEAGGFWRDHQIQKVTKSPATGRVVSVEVIAMQDIRYNNETRSYDRALRPMLLKIEKADPSAYRAPTDEERAAFAASTKAAAKASKPTPPPLINPTDEDAARLVEMWNATRREKHEAANIYRSPEARASHSAQFKPCEVQRVTQAVYSANSKGSYARAETRGICSLGRLNERNAFYDYSGQAQRAAERGPRVCEIRTTGFDPVHVLILTDKPQKPLPAAVWLPYVAPAAAAELVTA